MIIIYLACACSDDEHLSNINKFFYPIPETTLTEDVHLGAYYSVYGEKEWKLGYVENPELGEYDISANPELMSKQFKWATIGGIEYLILKWDNKDLDNKILDYFAQYHTSDGPRMVICYNIAHLQGTNESPIIDEKLNKMIDELTVLYGKHMSKNYYFSFNNRPVIMITSLIPSSSQLNAIDFQIVMGKIREFFSSLGVNPFFIGEIPTGWKAPQTYKKNILAMDAVVLTNWAPNDYDRSYAFCSFNDISWKNWCDSTSAWKKDFVPCIFSAYNDLKSNPKSKNIPVERSEKFFIDYCNVAKRNLGKNRFVIVNSWNDYNKGNTMEPTTEYGDTYLSILKEQFTVK